MSKATTEQMRLRRGGSYVLPAGASATDIDETARKAEEEAHAAEQAELDKRAKTVKKEEK